MLQVCVGKVCGFKIIDLVGSSMHCVYADNMVLNPNLDILSAITRCGYNFIGENCVLLYLNFWIIVCIKEGHFRECVIQKKWFILP